MKRREWQVAATLCGAALLRLAFLGRKSVWLDEAITANFAGETLETIWTQYYQPHPPLYFTFMHYWRMLFGADELFIRLPSAFISLINVAILYRLARRLFGPRVATAAAALLALAPLHVWYAQEARFYPFIVLCALLMALGMVRGDVLGALLLAASLGAGLYLNYIIWAVWPGLSALWLVWWWRRGRPAGPFIAWLAGSLLGLAAFIPWWEPFQVALGNFSNVVFFTNRLRALLGLAEWPPAFYFGGWLLGVIVAPLVTALAWWLWERPSLTRPTAWLVVAGFALVTLFAPYPRLFSVKRLLTVGWPFVILFVAYLWAQAPLASRPRLRHGLLALSLLASLVALAVPKDDWRGVFTFLENEMTAEEEVWLDPSFNRILADYYEPAIPVRRDSLNRQVPDPAPPTIWLIAERFNAPSGTERWLDAEGELLERRLFYRLEVRRYGVPDG